jgi:hypothetical protein
MIILRPIKFDDGRKVAADAADELGKAPLPVCLFEG